MKRGRRGVALISCAALMSLSLAGCGETETEQAASTVAVVEASSPTVGDLKLSNSFVATINPDESVNVIPTATAEVLEVLVSQGDTVEEGQVLAYLDDTLAQINMASAQLSLANAQLTKDSTELQYDLNYGDAATLLNDMNTDSSLSSVADTVNDLQEQLVEAMDDLAYYKSLLADEEANLASIKEEYDYTDDPDEIKDYAESIEPDEPNVYDYSDSGDTKNAEYLAALKEYQEEYATYASAMTRYSNAATEAAESEAYISSYKSAIDQYEEAIETLQDSIDSAYSSYSDAVVSSNISNGEMREEQKAVYEDSIAQTQIAVESAQLAIDQVQESLDGYTITAPISGVIETVNLSEHGYASSSSAAFVISNKDEMVATFYVSEDVRNMLSVGQEVSVEKDNVEYAGEIIEIGTALDQTAGLFKVKASISGDVSSLLSGTKATLTTDTYHENNALIIPYDAVYYSGSEAYVYTVVDGKAQKTVVETGLYDTDNIVITDGITADDVVITTWSAQLRDGVEVSIVDGSTDSDAE